jgi:uncharacterized protein YfkK (UPF0435 family)
MKNKNNTSLSYVLDSIMPMIEIFGIGLFAADSVWCMVLGVLPNSDSERDKQMMEFSRKDPTEYKVDNIKQITKLARLITKRPDYSISNITDFTYAMRQLIRYTSGDEIATNSLTKLKKTYISFITEYYYESMTLGKKDEALKMIKYFGEEILKEDEEMSTELVNILFYNMLS